MCTIKVIILNVIPIPFTSSVKSSLFFLRFLFKKQETKTNHEERNFGSGTEKGCAKYIITLFLMLIDLIRRLGWALPLYCRNPVCDKIVFLRFSWSLFRTEELKSGSSTTSTSATVPIKCGGTKSAALVLLLGESSTPDSPFPLFL